ncbi:MBL fold metallo-hydrolase [soil metagenome]
MGMLVKLRPGVLVHASDFLQSNAVVVPGPEGALLVDAGIRTDELAALAADLRERGLPVAVGFSTHPHWDHLLWHPDLGPAPRYGTALAATIIGGRLADENWRDAVGLMLPAELAGHVPLDDLFGRIIGLDSGELPWAGPTVRILQHSAHAPGHAALLVEELGVLVAGDMLSDILVPMLNGMSPDPIGDYLAGLQTIEDAAAGVELVIPGHGSVGTDLRARIELDRAYVLALRDAREPDDPRLTRAGWEWVRDLHAGQVQRLAQR